MRHAKSLSITIFTEDNPWKNPCLNYSYRYFYHGYFLGDWHCAYVLLYGPRILKIDESQNGEEEKSEEMGEESKTTTDAAMETS